MVGKPQIPCILKHVKDVEDRLSTLKGYSATYVKDGKKHTHTFLLTTSLIFNGFSIQKSFGKLRLGALQPYYQILCMLKMSKVEQKHVCMYFEPLINYSQSLTSLTPST